MKLFSCTNVTVISKPHVRQTKYTFSTYHCCWRFSRRIYGALVWKQKSCISAPWISIIFIFRLVFLRYSKSKWKWCKGGLSDFRSYDYYSWYYKLIKIIPIHVNSARVFCKSWCVTDWVHNPDVIKHTPQHVSLLLHSPLYLISDAGK